MPALAIRPGMEVAVKFTSRRNPRPLPSTITIVRRCTVVESRSNGKAVVTYRAQRLAPGRHMTDIAEGRKEPAGRFRIVNLPVEVSRSAILRPWEEQEAIYAEQEAVRRRSWAGAR